MGRVSASSGNSSGLRGSARYPSCRGRPISTETQALPHVGPSNVNSYLVLMHVSHYYQKPHNHPFAGCGCSSDRSQHRCLHSPGTYAAANAHRHAGVHGYGYAEVDSHAVANTYRHADAHRYAKTDTHGQANTSRDCYADPAPDAYRHAVTDSHSYADSGTNRHSGTNAHYHAGAYSRCHIRLYCHCAGLGICPHCQHR